MTRVSVCDMSVCDTCECVYVVVGNSKSVVAYNV